MKHLTNRRDQSGFSLVEVLVAMLVIGFLIIGMMRTEKMRWWNLARSTNVEDTIRAIEQKVESKRIGIFSTKTFPANGTVTTEMVNGIVLKDSIDEARDFGGTVLANTRSLTIWAYKPGGKDTITISTHVARDF